ncbi:MAG: PKD domain-containing protein, partial [Proteobacteria bacterium]|nr:PKD domain-containing protein [Pseudomonadota bacterium]
MGIVSRVGRYMGCNETEIAHTTMCIGIGRLSPARWIRPLNLKAFIVVALVHLGLAGIGPVAAAGDVPGKEGSVSQAKLPKSASADWWQRVQRGLAEAEYNPSRNKQGLQAPNRAHNLRTYFGPDGIKLRDRKADRALVGLSLNAMGRGTALSPIAAGEVAQSGKRVEIRRPGIVEWYKNTSKGLEQGFTLATRAQGKGKLVLELAVEHARARLVGKSIELATSTGRRLRYGKLKVEDAAGKILVSHLEAPTPNRLRLVVDDANAAYPVVIDPLVTDDPLLTGEPDAFLESNQLGSSGIQPPGFGRSVAGAGDVNGDGFADVIVGAWGWDGGASEEGAAFVFLGGPNGIQGTDPASAFAHIESNNGAARFGWSVSGAGDVNRDGFDDIVVGAPRSARAVDFPGFGLGTVRGEAFVYLGGATQMQGTADPSLANARIISNELDSRLGYSVSGAGDVNGDGFADIIVGAPRAGIPFLNPEIPPWDTQGIGGAALIFLGGPAGITGTGFDDAHKEIRPYLPGFPALPVDTAEIGVSVSGAGDVNGDLYDDIIVGSGGYAMVFLGSAAGIVGDDPTTAHAKIVGSADTPVGIRVSGAGDVNGDLYDDIIIGSPSAPVPPLGFSPEFEGAFLVFHGDPLGITATSATDADTIVRGAIRLQQLGWDVSAAGDVDKDGYDDVIVGTLNYAGSLNSEGGGYVFRGGPTGIADGVPAPSLRDDAYVRLEPRQSGAAIYLLQIGLSVAGVGDINGDGFADVMLGAGYYDNAGPNEGAAFVYHGGPAPAIRNQPPKPNAGADQSHLDLDDDGSATITVDGSASSDPEGSALSYAWYEGEALLGTSQVLTTDLTTTGRHLLVLEVTDDLGLTRGDPVDVFVGLVDRPFVSFDDFSSNGFAGGIGTWSGAWTIAGDVSLSSESTTSPSPPRALIGAGATLSRTATLPAGATGMKLQFQAKASQFSAGDTVAVQVSTDGGAFTTLKTFTVNDSDDAYHFHGGNVGGDKPITLSWYPATAANMVVRFASMAATGTLFVDEIRVTGLVAPPGELPPQAGKRPIANAGADVVVETANLQGQTVTLDGTLSFDPDPDGSIASYEWHEVTIGGTFPLGAGPSPNPTLPVLFGFGSHTVQLIVTDNTGGSARDTVSITVNQTFPNNQPPVANAGPDQNIVDTDGNTLEVVTFNGGASMDPDGNIVSYQWTKNGTFFGNSPTFSVTMPRGVHTVELTVTDDKGATSTDTVVVTVVASDTTFSIDSFTATPGVITAGDSTTLSWTTTNADSVSINGGAALPLDGSITVSPTTNTVYTLSVTGPGGTAIRSVTVGVNQPPPALPTVDSFSTTTPSITAGGSATLSWTTTDAASVSIDNGVGAGLPANSNISVSPATTTTYTLTATATGGGTANSALTITVNPVSPVAPTVDSFTATPDTITSGGSTTLAWTTTGADSVSIDGGASLPADGSVTMNPTATTTYILSATGGGQTANSTMTVTVTAPPQATTTTFSGRIDKNATITRNILIEA